MSTIKVDSIKSADGNTDLLTLSNGAVSGVNLGRRNIIINGAMQVAQRGTSATGKTGLTYNTVDRWRGYFGALGTWTEEKSTDSPDGFSSSLKVTCTTADASPAAGDFATVHYDIEAQDVQCLGYGTSSAKEMTLSFWVKSNKTGTASLEFLQPDNSLKQVTPTYTIASADTWEYKTVTIPADTSGVINNDNGAGFYINFWLNSGTSFNSGTNSATWQAADDTNRNASNLGVGGATSDYFAITGVQLEVGSVATPFEHRSYGEELKLCKRYFEKLVLTRNYQAGSTQWTSNGFTYETEKRANPTISIVSPRGTTGEIQYSDAPSYTTSVGSHNQSNQCGAVIRTQASGDGQYIACIVSADSEL